MDGGGGLQRTGLELDKHLGQLMFPGDEFIKPEGKKLILGPGLRIKFNCPEVITVDRAGILAQLKDNYYLQVKMRNYTHYKKDDVIGVIFGKKADNYQCDIGTRDRVELSKFAFEGATKRNKPNLAIGDLVYGRVMDKPKDLPLEITCVNHIGRAVGMGALQGGYTFQIPVHFVQVLRHPKEGKNSLMTKIGKIVPFESVIGDNGIVWVNAKNPTTTLQIVLLIQSAAAQHNSNGSFYFPELLKEFGEATRSSRTIQVHE